MKGNYSETEATAKIVRLRRGLKVNAKVSYNWLEIANHPGLRCFSLGKCVGNGKRPIVIGVIRQSASPQ